MWPSDHTCAPQPPHPCCDTLVLSQDSQSSAACRCPPCCDLGASGTFAVPQGNSMSWPCLEPLLFLPHCPLCCSPLPMCPAHPASNTLALRFRSQQYIWESAAPLHPSPHAPGGRFKMHKSRNRSCEPVNMNYLRAHPPRAKQSCRQR